MFFLLEYRERALTQQIAKRVYEWKCCESQRNLYIYICNANFGGARDKREPSNAHCHDMTHMSVFIRNVLFLLCVNIRKENRVLLLLRMVLADDMKIGWTGWECAMQKIDKITFSLLHLYYSSFIVIVARYAQAFPALFFFGCCCCSPIGVLVGVDFYKLSWHFRSTNTVKLYLCECHLLRNENGSKSVSAVATKSAFLLGCRRMSVCRLSHLALFSLN